MQLIRETTALRGQVQTATAPTTLSESSRNGSELLQCEICSGTGFVNVPAEATDHDTAWSAKGPAKLVQCKRCNPMSSAQERLRSICRLEGDELGFTFQGYDVRAHGEKPLYAARETLKANGWLTLRGEFGTGKTYLLAAIVNEAIAQGRMAIYSTMADMLEHLKVAFKPGAEVDFDALWDNVLRCDVLCIDEIEKFAPTPWAQEKLFQMVNSRYRNWQETVTCFATNDLANCPGYLKSRIMDGRFAVVSMTGAMRPQLRRERR